MQKIIKNDEVRIILGKDRGKTGKVERVLVKKGQVFVAGINISKRHVKKQGQVEGGILELIKPVKISNVVLVCPECKKTTRVSIKFEGSDKVRVCKKCQKIINKKS